MFLLGICVHVHGVIIGVIIMSISSYINIDEAIIFRDETIIFTITLIGFKHVSLFLHFGLMSISYHCALYFLQVIIFQEQEYYSNSSLQNRIPPQDCRFSM